MSADDRRARRRELLVEACLTVVAERGLLGTTVDRVCEEARLTKRYLYESFANLDDLLVAAADAMFTSLFVTMEAATQGMEKGAAKARSGLGAVMTALAGDRRLSTVYLACAAHPKMRIRRGEAIETFAAFFVAEVARAPAETVGVHLRARLVVAGATDLMTSMLAEEAGGSVDDVLDAIFAVAIDL